MKVFDLDGAREALVLIKPLVEAINIKRQEIYNVLEEIQEETDMLEKMYKETQIKELDEQIRRHFEKIEALGGVIKGIDPILVDFLGFYENRYIWYCWKEDEDTIMYWHELDEGFAGRKPISFLKEEWV